MKQTYVIPLMVGAVIVFLGLAWWGWAPISHTLINTTNQPANTTNTTNSSTSVAGNVNAVTVTGNVNTNTVTPTNTNSGVNVDKPTNTSTAVTTGAVPTFFAATASTWRPTTKSQKMPNGRTLVEYAYNLAYGLVPGARLTLGGTGIRLAEADKTPEVNTADVVSPEAWKGHVPSGHAFLKVNWFCSAALTHLTNITGGQTQAIGDFTGDCTNSNVSVKGNFMPLKLGDFSPSKELNFRIASEHQTLGMVTHESSDPGECVIDRIENAGTAGVFAVQYTCDDGYNVGRSVLTNINGNVSRVPSDLNNNPTVDATVHPDDIQFTVYVFPNNWASPTDPLDLLTTADKNSDDDGDGLTYVQEVQDKTNPNNSDSDYDGLGDFEEIMKYKTNPMKADTDGDGVKDGAEVAANQNPLGAGAATAEQLAAWGVAPSQVGKTVLSNIKASFSNGYMTVAWDNAPSADGIVNWGSTTDYGSHQSDYAFSASHSISFPATSGQTVHYAIRSCTPAPNSLCTVSSDLTYIIP